MADDPSLENTNYKAILCLGIPELFLDKLTAKKHFSRFGKVNRFILRPKRLSCTVEYETEEAAERAYLESGVYNGHEFFVDYAKLEVAHVQNTEDWIDPEVQAELEAMNSNLSVRIMPPSLPVRQTSMPPPTVPSLSQTRPAISMSNNVTAILKSNKEKATTAVMKIDTVARAELEALLRKPAFTDEEKYRVLDARDKLMRLTTVRQTDISKAVRTKGICPDMCPEKERLMREFQRQVVSFEMDNNSKISHFRAIKEYSRSSADQEVPLHHELRSENVLQMTMLYLMHCIMDLCDTDPHISLADWFHFVWDRTRSIRKDITQQELCSLAAVELLEQCARFHIHCAARLVAEDPSVFDKKINAENLTKCLQTLKYMYHDLRIKGILCPREAEFRSYIILLNMADSNFLWELKWLPMHIQASPELIRAIAFYNALQHNNYVRFFNMVRSKETSYLSACILLMYFNKLRVRSMKVIYKSHNWRKNATILPLEHLTHILGFESIESAALFFTAHGWQCDKQWVKLDQVHQPQFGYSMERAFNLVESKRTVSVGECVYGRELGDASLFASHQPHNSFNSNGLLRLEAWTAEDQLRGDAADEVKRLREEENKLQSLVQKTQPSSSSLPFQSPVASQWQSPSSTTMSSTVENNIFKVPLASAPSSPRQQQQQQQQQQRQLQLTQSHAFTAPMTIGNDNRTGTSNIFAVTSSLPSSFNRNLFSNTTTTSSSIFGFANANKLNTPSIEPSNSLKNTLPTFSTDNIFRHYSNVPVTAATLSNSNTMHGQETEIERFKRAELKKQIEEKRLRQLEEDQRQFAELENQRAITRENEMKLQQAIEATTEELLMTVLTEKVKLIASKEITRSQHFDSHCQKLSNELLEIVVRSEIEDLAREEYATMYYNRKLLKRCIEEWMHFTNKCIDERLLLAQTPVWTVSDIQVDEFQHPQQEMNLTHMKRYRYGSPLRLKQLLETVKPNLNRESVDFFQIVQKHQDSDNLNSLTYFKLIISIPDEKEEESPGFQSLCDYWLGKYLLVSDMETPSYSHDALICSLRDGVALCVVKVYGKNSHTKVGQNSIPETCDNANAVLCLMNSSNVKVTRQRLERLMKLSEFGRKIPLAIVAYDAENIAKDVMRSSLGLMNLQNEEKLLAHKIFGCGKSKTNFRFEVLLEQALNFVVSCAASIPKNDIEMISLTDWLFTCFGEEMWLRWQYAEQNNPAFRTMCKKPKYIVSIFNEGLQRLHKIVLRNWQLAPEFPSELRHFVQSKTETELSVSAPTNNLAYFPFDWKSPKRITKLEQLLEALRLPDIQNKDLCTDVEACEIWLMNYASRYMPHDDSASTKAAHQAVTVLFQQLNSVELKHMLVSDRFEYISYLQIMREIVVPGIYTRITGNHSLSLPNEVFYYRSDMETYLNEPWWLDFDMMEGDAIEPSSIQTVTQTNTKLLFDLDEIAANITMKAEEISRRTDDMTTLKIQRKQKHMASSTIELKNELDECLHQFEIAKQIGAYDFSGLFNKVTDTDNHIDLKANSLFTSSPLNRRKRKYLEEVQNTETDSETTTEVDVTTKAFDLIRQLERNDDENLKRLQKTAKYLEDSTQAL